MQIVGDLFIECLLRHTFLVTYKVKNCLSWHVFLFTNYKYTWSSHYIEKKNLNLSQWTIIFPLYFVSVWSLVISCDSIHVRSTSSENSEVYSFAIVFRDENHASVSIPVDCKLLWSTSSFIEDRSRVWDCWKLESNTFELIGVPFPL